MLLERLFALFLKMANVTITVLYTLLARDMRQVSPPGRGKLWRWKQPGKESKVTHLRSTIAELIKWSYADSPYCCFGDENFDNVKQRFTERPFIADLENDEGNREFDLRLKAMELAMKMLDDEGVFALNQLRESVCVLVEVMPPDEINTEIALRLNRAESSAMQVWLAEAAE